MCRDLKDELTQKCSEEIFKTQVEVSSLRLHIRMLAQMIRLLAACALTCISSDILHDCSGFACVCAQAAKDYRTDADLHAACEPDAKQLCADVNPGEGRVQVRS